MQKKFTKTLEQNEHEIRAASGFITTTCYINRTGTTIYIKDRSGCITEIPPTNARIDETYPTNSLIIQEINTTVERNFDSWKIQLKDMGVQYASDRHIARANGASSYVFPVGDKKTQITTFVVDLTGYLRSCVFKYVPEYDIVVIAGASFESALLATHPACKFDQIVSASRSFIADKDVYVKFRNIANQQSPERVWVILNNEVLEVLPSEEPYLTDGIYISYRSSDGYEKAEYYESIDKAKTECARYSFFSSSHEAYLWLSERESEVQRMKLEEQRLKAEQAEINAVKAKHELDQMHRKHEEDRIKHQRAIDELVMQNKRSKMEQETKLAEYGRKNTTDILRYVATFVTSVISLLALYKRK